MKNNTNLNTLEAYSKALSMADESDRQKLFELSLSPDCIYTDPLVQTKGYAQLSAYISELHKNIPDVAFVITNFKFHHDRSLAHWNMVDGNDNLIFEGASYGLYGVDGRLTQMTGFFEPPQAN